MVAPFITRVALKNYKSIAACNVRLGNLTFLVGRNASGKSNFLDAFAFVADALRDGLDHALRERGSLDSVLRRSPIPATTFGVRLSFRLPQGTHGYYGFEVGEGPGGAAEVRFEVCSLIDRDEFGQKHRFVVKDGVVLESSTSVPAIVADRLALVNFAGNKAFREAFDALSRIEVYDLDPEAMAPPRRVRQDDRLGGDGANAAAILRRLDPEDRSRLAQTLARIAPNVRDVSVQSLGDYEAVTFAQIVDDPDRPVGLGASSASEGTLRSLGMLLATAQSPETGALLVGIEEPETAIHPAATHVLLQALRRASERRQVLATSHSPDLLDDPDIEASELLSVKNVEGATYVGPVDAASRSVIADRLFTPGELLRQDQIGLDEASERLLTDAELSLFGEAL